MAVLCRVMNVSASAYYNWLKDLVSYRERVNASIREKIQPIFSDSRGTYGRRRLRAALKNQGFSWSVNRVERRMKELGIKGYTPRAFKKTTKGDPSQENSPNLLKESCNMASTVNQIWVSDITYIATKSGWLYLCIVLDIFSRKVVGWSVSNNMKAGLVLEALRTAFKDRKPPEGLIVHSDCGGQYKAKKVRALLRRKRCQQSMTNAGNCYDNATAESFFGTLKTELIRGVKFENFETAKSAIFEYIEVFYNRFRLHSSLDYQSPASFEGKIA